MPNGPWRVSPWTTSTWSGEIPRRSAPIWAHPVSWHRARGSDPADLHVGGEPHAAVDPTLAQLGLLAPEALEVELLEQSVQRAVVVARVVGDPHCDVRGEVLLRDEVLPA